MSSMGARENLIALTLKEILWLVWSVLSARPSQECREQVLFTSSQAVSITMKSSQILSGAPIR